MRWYWLLFKKEHSLLSDRINYGTEAGANFYWQAPELAMAQMGTCSDGTEQ